MASQIDGINYLDNRGVPKIIFLAGSTALPAGMHKLDLAKCPGRHGKVPISGWVFQEGVAWQGAKIGLACGTLSATPGKNG